MRESVRYRDLESHDKLLFWYSLLMGFPIILVIFNISIYLFPFLLLSFTKRFGYLFNFNKVENISLVYFAVGAIMSVLDLYFRDTDQETKNLSFQVLLNYIYWVVLVSFLLSHSNNLNFTVIAKGLFTGILISTLYYFYLQGWGIRAIPIFKSLSQNAYAFLLIMFAPISIWFLYRRSVVQAVFFAVLFILCAFLSGSRSASVLVFIGCTSVLFFKNAGYLFRALPFLIIILSGLIVLDSEGSLESVIKSLNPRTHQLLYNSDQVIAEDRSYLTRVAMVKKGLAIYEDYPLFGIGLNNFTNYEAKIAADFEGAEFVVHKEKINETSSHNSYINILAETGLFGFIPFILLLIIPLFRITFKGGKLDLLPIAYFSGFVCMLIHLYFITAIVNVFSWYMIGISIAMTYTSGKKAKQ